jgi:hypothetical protein
MTASTAVYLFPYSTPGDAIASVDDTMKALAERMEGVLYGGDIAEQFLANSQNIAAGGSANLGSLFIPTTYRRRTLMLFLHATPATATSVSQVLTPNYADPRMYLDPAYPLRQYTGAAALGQVTGFQIPIAPGAGGTTQFQLAISASAGLNNVRLRAWVA